MKRKPWAIVVLSLLHVLAPIGNIVLNSHRTGRTYSQTWDFWYYILPKVLFVSYVILPPLAGIFIFICKRWSYWSYVACLGLIFLGNVYGFWTSMNMSNLLFLVFVMVIDILVVGYFVAPSVRKVYFDPRMRWWETAPRYVFNVPGLFSGAAVLVKNISEGGAFVETASAVSEGQSIELQWSYEGEEYTVPGKVVYIKPISAGVGCGVRFDHTASTQKFMATLIAKVHKEGKLIRDRLPGPEDSFLTWVKNLFVLRQGIFPKRDR